MSERVQGKYIPRVLLEAIRLGNQRTCIYELLDFNVRDLTLSSFLFPSLLNFFFYDADQFAESV